MSVVTAFGRLATAMQNFTVVTHRATDATNVAAALVPSIFRRDSPADVARLALERFVTGLTLRAFTRTSAADVEILRRQLRRPFRG